MTIWEQLKRFVNKKYGKGTAQNPLVSGACGAVSGAVASTSMINFIRPIYFFKLFFLWMC